MKDFKIPEVVGKTFGLVKRKNLMRPIGALEDNTCNSIVFSSIADSKKALEKVVDLIKQGYQIRFAGGTSKDGSHNATVVPSTLKSCRTLSLTAVPYKMYTKKLSKDEQADQGEESFLYDVNDPVILGIDKLEEEIGFIANYDDLRQVREKAVQDNRYKDGRLHHKHVFVIEKFEGEFINSKDKSFPKRETLNPFWIPARILPDFIFEGHLDFFEDIVDDLYYRDKLNSVDFIAIKENIYKRRIFAKEGIRLEYFKVSS